MYARSVEDLHQAAFARWTDHVTRRRHAPMALGPLASHLAPASTLGGFPGGRFLPRPPFTPGPRRWRTPLAGSYAFDDFAVTGLSVNRYIFDPSDDDVGRVLTHHWPRPRSPANLRYPHVSGVQIAASLGWPPLPLLLMNLSYRLACNACCERERHLTGKSKYVSGYGSSLSV